MATHPTNSLPFDYHTYTRTILPFIWQVAQGQTQPLQELIRQTSFLSYIPLFMQRAAARLEHSFMLNSRVERLLPARREATKRGAHEDQQEKTKCTCRVE